MRARTIAQPTLAVEEDDGLGEAVQAAHMAGLVAHEIAELSGVPMRRVLEILGQPED